MFVCFTANGSAGVALPSSFSFFQNPENPLNFPLVSLSLGLLVLADMGIQSRVAHQTQNSLRYGLRVISTTRPFHPVPSVIYDVKIGCTQGRFRILASVSVRQ